MVKASKPGSPKPKRDAAEKAASGREKGSQPDGGSQQKLRASHPRVARAPVQAKPPGPPHPLIVGIGASAGGLEAFKTFFTHMPADSEMAFVLVQHLAPDHQSMLAELLGRGTAMTVCEAEDGEKVQARHVYVIPPDATLTIAAGTLQVTRPAPPRQHRWPIDAFFSSLAQDQGSAAVCVVLAGSGSDGAHGLRAIKERGGLVLAQAGFDHVAMSGMPASAEATGLVDEVLPVEDMPQRLIAHYMHLQSTQPRLDDDGVRTDLGAHLQPICVVLRAETGHDFSGYKEKTLLRRIQRRMHVKQTETPAEYLTLLGHDPGECRALFHEILIGVTQFFRDTVAFEALQANVLPRLLEGKGTDDALRTWVVGCATGEEAYSVAIALRETVGDTRPVPQLLVFATDLDERAISVARAGRYRAPLDGVSPERLARWFRREGDDYIVNRSIREMCVFSPHSAIKDPPFSRLDLITCRNLMIYLKPELQQRLIQMFHYALRGGGVLMLGSSEGISRSAQLFTHLDKKHRLFARRGDVAAEFPIVSTRKEAERPSYRAAPPLFGTTESSMDRSARRALEKYSPAYVVIDEHHDILRFGGDTGRYLGPSSGAASLNLFALMHRGLRGTTRNVVKRAFASNAAASEITAMLDSHQQLQVIAEPLSDAGTPGRLCAVAFVEMPQAASASEGGDSSLHARALEQELEAARAQLVAAQEQHETLDEEMKSANEEYQSVNEELQSSNEELETSKEEMQSINEELQTVNTELQVKNATLASLNSDLRNLMESTQVATLFL
ncbi:MAG: chemotaxis protein CheB, partial [Rhodanobacter sp.]